MPSCLVLLKKTLMFVIIMASCLEGCFALAKPGKFETNATNPMFSTVLPQVQEIITRPPQHDRDVLRQDVFVGLYAIKAPMGMDYMSIGQEVLWKNTEHFEKALLLHDVASQDLYEDPLSYYGGNPPLELDLHVNGEDFIYACKYLGNHTCIEQTLARKDDITMLVNQNKELMQRYLNIQQLPYYGNYVYRVNDYFPNYYVYVLLSELRLAQAIIAFEEGDANTAFDLLNTEMRFSRRMLSQDQLLIGKLIAVVKINTIYHTLSALLDRAYMQPYLQDQRLQELLQPLNPLEQKAMADAFRHERNWGIYFCVFQFQEMQEMFSSKLLFDQFLFYMLYDPDVTVNLAYLVWEPVIQRASMDMDEVSALYLQGRLTSLEAASQQVLSDHIERNDELRQSGQFVRPNLLGESLLSQSIPAWSPQLERLYDLQSYILLVNAKYQILRAGVGRHGIQEFLKTGLDFAYNPITREPFTWDASTGTLSTSWLSSKPTIYAREKPETLPLERIGVMIHFNE